MYVTSRKNVIFSQGSISLDNALLCPEILNEKEDVPAVINSFLTKIVHKINDVSNKRGKGLQPEQSRFPLDLPLNNYIHWNLSKPNPELINNLSKPNPELTKTFLSQTLNQKPVYTEPWFNQNLYKPNPE